MTHHNFQWVVLLSESSWLPVLRRILIRDILPAEQMQLHCSISSESGAHMHCNVKTQVVQVKFIYHMNKSN